MTKQIKPMLLKDLRKLRVGDVVQTTDGNEWVLVQDVGKTEKHNELKVVNLNCFGRPRKSTYPNIRYLSTDQFQHIGRMISSSLSIVG